MAALELSPPLTATVTPVCQLLACINEEVRRADSRLGELVTTDPDIAHLTTFPSIGPITAAAFVAALDDVTRFRRASQVANYLGLVPREYSSGELQRRGHIVRSAHPRVQALLVQAAWRIWLSKRDDTSALRTWAQLLAKRRSPRIAIVALARRVARILFGMWRDETDYQPPCRRVRAPAQAVTPLETATV